MSDQEKPNDQQAEKTYQSIHIDCHADGIRITGNVKDMGEVYRLLGLAQDFFKAGFLQQLQAQRQANGSIISRLRNGKF